MADDTESLYDEIVESKAYQVRLRMQVLETNYYVFDRNYQDFIRLIGAVEHPDSFSKVWTSDKKSVMQSVLSEIARLLQNLVAAESLVEHIRNLMNDWYKDSVFLGQYQHEVSRRFGDSQRVKFVEDLRNYCLHFRLPPVAGQFEIRQENDVPIQMIMLDKAELLTWDGWTANAKQFLAASDDRIRLGEVAKQYHSEVTEFYQWMRLQIAKRHATELEWLDENLQRYQRVKQGGH